MQYMIVQCQAFIKLLLPVWSIFILEVEQQLSEIVSLVVLLTSGAASPGCQEQ